MSPFLNGIVLEFRSKEIKYKKSTLAGLSLYRSVSRDNNKRRELTRNVIHTEKLIRGSGID
jgi:hypothetical protein